MPPFIKAWDREPGRSLDLLFGVEKTGSDAIHLEFCHDANMDQAEQLVKIGGTTPITSKRGIPSIFGVFAGWPRPSRARQITEIAPSRAIDPCLRHPHSSV